ncbi:MAG: YceI family protein [Elusimicrobia bacterium]|nr:YceI family protein [Elusimicrobiota bacterium]
MKTALALALLAAAAPRICAETYQIDPDHSEVRFKIHHLVGNVGGAFDRFEGSFDFDPKKPGDAKAWAKIDAASINTRNEKRDGHLRSPDFFDAVQHPFLEFKSKKLSLFDGKKGKLSGTLTMHGVTKPVVLEVKMGEIGKDPWGGVRAGFSAEGTLHRKDFGIVWNKTLDNGGLMLGDDVKIEIEIEGKAAPKDAQAQK